MDLNLKTPKPLPPTKKASAFIVLDYMGWSQQTPEEEFAATLETYAATYGIKLDATVATVFDSDQAEHAEIVIFDWGGASLGNDLMGSQLRSLIPWAEDHPSTLIVIQSMLSWQWLEKEWSLYERMRTPVNVIYDDGRLESLPAWWTKGLRTL